ncbi:hypothetical protein [Paraburkholderia bannensis]|uniref:hypothetical protein n=1 Tax=Paraburkholderia bannensis TaxID=765414 RepID=UPI002AB171BC|nr:hypothetical protein [Paraburkholderia bannensis]
MKERNAFNAGFGGKSPVAIGRLEELRSWRGCPDLKEGLPEDMPFLTFPLTPHEARCIPNLTKEYCFMFGQMQLSDRMLMTMRLQLDGNMFYWIAEMTDPAVWAAIDMWRKYERLPIGLKVDNGDGWSPMFLDLGFTNKTLSFEKYRAAPRREPTAHDLYEMVGLVTGYVQMQATTDFEHIPLQRVFASVLLTEQYEGVASHEPMVKKPVMVLRPDGMGATILG